MQQLIQFMLREKMHTYSNFSYCEAGKISKYLTYFKKKSMLYETWPCFISLSGWEELMKSLEGLLNVALSLCSRGLTMFEKLFYTAAN